MSRIVDKIEKFNDCVSNHYINIQINVMPFGVNSYFKRLFLIPTTELEVCKKEICISFYILCFCLYLNFALKNYNTDES